MNTISTVVYESRSLETGHVYSPRVIGVFGYDYLYPAFHEFVPLRTAGIGVGCSSKVDTRCLPKIQ